MAKSLSGWYWHSGLASCLAFYGVSANLGDCASAQVVPDSTLGAESSVVTPNTDGVDVISGGATRGANLFHSFEQFSVPTGGTAFFNNAANIQNIISRVTGGSVSNIDGLLQANGTANLFLINPSGIIFGPNATLDIGGSFLASTAERLNFADGSFLSATASQATPLLSVSVPIGLQFGNNPGSIVVKGNSQGVEGLTTTSLLDFTVALPVGLRVQPNQTLAIVGGDLVLEGGTLKTAGGRIELGSVAGSSQVRLTPTEKGWALGYDGVPTSPPGSPSGYGDIQLSGMATVDAREEGGDIQVRGRRVTLTDGSQIEARTLGAEPGGTLTVRASESVEAIGTSADGLVASGLFTSAQPKATGDGGNLTLETGRLILRDGAQIGVTTSDAGAAGNLEVRARESVELIGKSANGQFPSGLFTSVQQGATGAGGKLTVETGRLIVRDGAQIGDPTLGEGSAGNLVVRARDSVELIGTEAFDTTFASGLFTSAQPGATGNGGNLTLETGRLIVRDGAAVSTGTLGEGSGGTLTVIASDSVELRSTLVDGQRLGGRLTAQTTSTGNAGDLRIETGQLRVQDGAQVTVSSRGSGKAGNLQVQARSVQLDNQGAITATTLSGNGGNITLQAQDLLLLRRNSQISTSAGNNHNRGNGGNITINTPLLVAIPQENSDISANAFTGNGGEVRIDARGIEGTQFREQPTRESDITASSVSGGINGVVTINTPLVDPSLGLLALPAQVVEREGIIATGCNASNGTTSSQFTVTGRGGLPPSPYDALTSDTVWEDARFPVATMNQQRSALPQLEGASPHPPHATPPSGTAVVPIVPATGWVFNNLGLVTLTALAPSAPASIGSNRVPCHGFQQSAFK